MERILVLYGTMEGQSRRIAGRIRALFQAEGVLVEMMDVHAAAPEIFEMRADGLVLVASVHVGRHSPSVHRFVEAHLGELARVRTGFLSVSLSAREGGEPDEARRYLEEFREKTGWRPEMEATVGGALRYRSHGFLRRLMMKRIARRTGLPTDATRDYDYTDWGAVEVFALEFLALGTAAGS